MKIAVTLCALTCTMMATAVRAQDVDGIRGPRGTVGGVPTRGAMAHNVVGSAAASQFGAADSVMDLARRAVLRLASQPNTAPQQRGRGIRERLGYLWVVSGGTLAVLGYMNDEFSEDEKLVFSLIGGGLAGIGGYLIATADSTSRVKLGGAKPGGRIAVAPMRGGAIVVHRTRF